MTGVAGMLKAERHGSQERGDVITSLGDVDHKTELLAHKLDLLI